MIDFLVVNSTAAADETRFIISATTELPRLVAALQASRSQDTPKKLASITITATRSQNDCIRYFSRLAASFPSLFLPAFPEDGKLSDCVPAVQQKHWWLSCQLKLIGTVDEFVNSDETIRFIDPTQPQSGPQQVRLKPGIVTLAQLDQRLLSVVHSVRLPPEQSRPKGKLEAAMDENLVYLKSLAPRTQGLAAELLNLRGRLERDCSDRLKHAAKNKVSGTTGGFTMGPSVLSSSSGSTSGPVEGPGKVATAVAAAVSLFQGSRWDNVDDNSLQIGDRVASAPGRIGVVMYLAPKGPKKGERLVGVCWDDERSGNCDGTLDGVKYFHCRPRQGSFQKTSTLYWEATEDDVLSSLAAVTAEVDRTLNAVPDEFVDDAVYLLGVTSFYTHFLQSAAVWIQQMLQYHRSIVSVEHWLQGPKPPQKATTAQSATMSEADVRELLSEYFALWKRSAFDFSSVWACYAPVRRGMSCSLACRFAKLAGRLEGFSAESLVQQLQRQNSMTSFDDIHSLFGALSLF
jgi:hypothetical protein